MKTSNPHAVLPDKSESGASTPVTVPSGSWHGLAWWLWGAVVLVILAVGIVIGRGGWVPWLSRAGVTQGTAMYHCPMHPTVVQDRKGSCPICGMDLVAIGDSKREGADRQATTVQYHCPMHPTVVQDKKGSCPICGMDLVPMEGHKTEPSGSDVPGLAAVEIDSGKRRLMGLRLGAVQRRSLTVMIRTSAKIVADETRLYRVTAKVDGWVDRLFVATTGQAVDRGDPLLTLYSPDLVSAQTEYLTAFGMRKTATGSELHAQTGGDALLAASRRRLELWDISEEQIQALERSGKVEKSLTLLAPASGWVTERMVLAGQKIMSGEALMVITDLKDVWADADIYQSDLSYVKVGMPVEVVLPYLSGQTFTGRVSFVSPTLDPMTRTLKARLGIPNPDLLLKPEMYAVATLRCELGERLAVPVTAVMFTGSRVVAFRDAGEGRLVPVELKLGARSGDLYEVQNGLKEGDQVVVAANFLVDSESSMKAAMESLSGGASEEAAHPEHSEHAGH